MGTAKRERQKANRQLKLEQLTKQQRQQKVRRRALQFGVIIPLAVVALIGLILVLSNNDDETAATTTVPVTATPTTLAPETTVPPTTVPPLPCPAEDGSSTKTQTFPSPPAADCLDYSKVYLADVTTNKGSFTIELDPGLAPQTVNNFVYLARYHYFDGTVCHRIIKTFVVQCGSPDGSPNGGPGYRFADELPAAGSYQIGSLAMANSGPDTNGSQFFIITGDRGTKLPPSYSLFGKVTDGFDTTVKAMEAAGTDLGVPNEGTPTEEIRIQTVVIRVKEGATPTPTTVTPSTTAAPAPTTTASGTTTAAPATTAAPSTTPATTAAPTTSKG